MGKWYISSTGFTDKSVFNKVYALIVDFTKEIIDCSNPQTIVLVQRKGRRIFNDIFDHYPELIDQRNVVLDTSVRKKHLQNMNVLILDDSVKSGKAIIDTVSLIRSIDDTITTSKIRLATLLANDYAISRILSETKINIDSMKKFETYELQNDYYINNIEYVVDGISTKYGTGHVVCEINLESEQDFKHLIRLTKSVITSIFGDSSLDFECREGYRDDCFLDVRIPNSILLDQKCMDGDNKIRFSFVRLNESKTKVTYESMINPCDIENCDKNTAGFRFCECNCYQKFDEAKLKNEICIHCKVFNLSFMYAKIIRDGLIQKFKSDGISIKNAVFYPPSEFRHPAEIEQFLVYHQS